MADAKGYWVVRVDITNDAAYQQYTAVNGAAFAKFGARFVVRGGAFEIVEGEARARNVVLEFPSIEAAHACYHSPEYAAARACREGAAVADIIIIGGYDGPQPEAP